MRRIALLLFVAVALAGCGGSSKSSAPTTTAPVVPKPGPGTVLYQSNPWAVVLAGTKARALRLAGGAWRADTSGAVHIAILGPHAKAAATPQVAVELSASSPLVESGLWVDGTELTVKGGGLRPTRGTIYGAPSAPLAKGLHVAVAYGRTATHATAVAWSFRV
jgi:uncharacterized protein YceK